MRNHQRGKVRKLSDWGRVLFFMLAVSPTVRAADTLVIHIAGEGDHGQYILEGNQSPNMIDVPIGTSLVWKNDAKKSKYSATTFGKEPVFTTGAIEPGGTSKPITIDAALFKRLSGRDSGSVEVAYHSASDQKVVGKLRLLSGRMFDPKAPATYSVNASQSLPGGYAPDTLVLKVGDKITWTNIDSGDTLHTATAYVNSMLLFDTGDIAAGQSASQTFTSQVYQQAGGSGGQPVTIKYSCSYHPSMIGYVTLSP